MRYRGEITVFLSLTLICVMSLLLGLLESARTTGARLYLRMASDSAVSSVMSYYNRNLWDRYQLLFLEYESEAAIRETFGRYLDFYLEQANMYPARRENVSLSGITRMTDEDGKWLEEEIVSYMKYRVPELLTGENGLQKEAEQGKKAGDFQTLYESCRHSGRMVRGLERAGQKIENSVKEMNEWNESLSDAVSEEQKSALKRSAAGLKKEAERFPGFVREFKRELKKLEDKTGETDTENIGDETASETLKQEVSACREVIQSAKERLERYEEAEAQAERNTAILEEILELSEMEAEDDEETGIDWDAVSQCAEEIELPEMKYTGPADKKKASALESLEKLFDKELFELLLPPGTEISGKAVSLNGIPSKTDHKENLERPGAARTETLKTAGKQVLVNAYIPLYFSSFAEKAEGKESVLDYEMEYLLSGKKSDRENLKEAVNRVIALRGAMNLLFLLNSPERKAEADALAAAVSAGIVPSQMVLSFFILTIWALGEAVLDVRTLLLDGKVPFWKTEETWKTGLSGLLDQTFLKESAESSQEGRSYTEYLSCLLFLTDRRMRNFRMMDEIQWNLRMKQKDFSVKDCAYQIELQTEVLQKHMFFQKEEYRGSVYAAGSYG